MFQIRHLDRKNSDEVNNIRKEAYAKAKGMAVKDSGIFWNRSDDQSIVLGVYKEDSLIATMRSEIITTLEIVEKKMECPWSYDRFSFPAMILSKAAISSNYEGKGLTSILRFFFFKLAEKWKIKTILGTMTANSLRIKSMESLGYRFVENHIGWKNDNYISKEKVLISILDFEKFGTAALIKLEYKYKNFIDRQVSIDLSSVHYSEVSVVS